MNEKTINPQSDFLIEDLVSKLKQLRLSTAAAKLLEQQNVPAFEQQSFEKRLLDLINEELDQRSIRRQIRLVKEAKLTASDSCARLEDVILSPERGIKPALFAKLKTCNWMKAQIPPSLVITGPSGSGKSFLCAAFIRQAACEGIKGLYLRCPLLLASLDRARKEATLEKKLASLKKIPLLVIDDIGVRTMTNEHCASILDVINDRYGLHPTIYASQYPVDEWKKLMPKEAAADALLDRVIHGTYLIELQGESLRKNIS